jgi:TatD DNase family protein
MIDSHCHLAGSEFAADLEQVVGRAQAAGLTGALVILAADDGGELQQAAAVVEAWPSVRFSIGVHPHAAGTFSADPEGAAGRVEASLTAAPGHARAVGEIGLDYHYDYAPRDVQQRVFAAQVRLARRLALPVVLHTREAEDDTFRILEEEGEGQLSGVFHCFTGDRAMARRALDLGFHLSLAGIVTFPRAQELREVAALVPPDRLLIETDSPFLAPVPHRGKRNEPAYVVRVAEVIATVRGVTVAELGDTTRANFVRLFRP